MGGRGSSSGFLNESQLKNQSEKWYLQKLTDSEKQAVTTYTYNNYTKDESQSKMTQDLESALRKFELTKELTVFRGVSVKEFADIMFSQKGVTDSVKSTSISEFRAKAFASGQGDYIIEYKIKPGIRGAYLDGGVPGSVEQEFLLHSGQQYKFITQKSKRHIVVEIG